MSSLAPVAPGPGLTSGELGNAELDHYTWRPLRVLSYYRLAVAAVLLLIFLGTYHTDRALAESPSLFLGTTLGYLIFGLLALALIWRRRPSYTPQVHLQVILDLLAFEVLIYASGSVGNGLGVLMVVALAGASLLLSTRTASFYASLAVVLLLGQQVWSHLLHGAPLVGYSQVGALGVGLLATAVAGSLLARRAQESQQLADRRRQDIDELRSLNTLIVQQLQAGVIVLDAAGGIRSINQSGWRLLGQPPQTIGLGLDRISRGLHKALNRWRSKADAEQEVSVAGHEVRVQFRPVGDGCIVFLEDLTALKGRVQQEKLASLGRLTASIAHEIRNPLSAIRHAAQLLEEVETLDEADRRLTEIVRNQSDRLNSVVNSVLQLSRRQQPDRQRLRLQPWLAWYVTELRRMDPGVGQIELAVEPPSLEIGFDPNHLQQVVGNLVSNARSHSGLAPSELVLRFQGLVDETGRPALEISDNGRGVSAEQAGQLFEPFFTTAAHGTGLGLYLCRELCELNLASLRHVATDTGACFRLSFDTAE